MLSSTYTFALLLLCRVTSLINWSPTLAYSQLHLGKYSAVVNALGRDLDVPVSARTQDQDLLCPGHLLLLHSLLNEVAGARVEEADGVAEGVVDAAGDQLGGDGVGLGFFGGEDARDFADLVALESEGLGEEGDLGLVLLRYNTLLSASS